jgi:hypothetical protein
METTKYGIFITSGSTSYGSKGLSLSNLVKLRVSEFDSIEKAIDYIKGNDDLGSEEFLIIPYTLYRKS